MQIVQYLTSLFPTKTLPVLFGYRLLSVLLFSNTKTTHMKSFTALLTAASFLAISFGTYAQNPTAKQVANKPENMPYKVENTNLRFGNSQYSMKVLQAWKAYDENNLDKVADMFADDVWGTLADGTVIKGKEAFINALKTYRGSFAAVESAVHACTTLKSAEDPDRDATLIWGMETDTKKDGTVQKVSLHEVWFFNQVGKVAEFHQFAAPVLEEKK